jgi:glycosyltransferase involved in cell wall biosynthesis
LNKDRPKISVVIASKVGPPFIDHCVRSVQHQAGALGAEVIVVVAGAAERADAIARNYPWARVVHAPGISKVPALRRFGVEQSTGELIAVIEEHCSAKEDWLQQAINAQASGRYGAVGGPVVDFDYPRLRDWTVYFIEYHGALPPFSNGETEELNDANIAYPRQLLLDHAELLDEGYWPMTLHPTLRSKGVRFLSAPEMVVYHRGPFDFGYYLGQRFLFSRAYTGVRAQQKSIPWRLAYLLGAPVIPIMMLARIGRLVAAKRCRVGKFMQALPLTIVALTVLVAGEWTGCLLGPGDALSKVE